MYLSIIFLSFVYHLILANLYGWTLWPRLHHDFKFNYTSMRPFLVIIYVAIYVAIYCFPYKIVTRLSLKK